MPYATQRAGASGGGSQRDAACPRAGSDSLYRRLVDSVAGYAIHMLDPTGRVLTWNAGAQALLGYGPDEIINQPLERIYTPEDVAAGRPRLDLQVAAREGETAHEGWRRRKDGSRFWARVVTSVVRGADGAPDGFAQIIADLTAAQRAEEALRHSEEHFRLLVQSVRDYAILLLDTNGTIVSWNEGAERIKGYTAAEVVGRPFTIFYPPEAVAAGHPRRELETARRDGRFEDEDWRVRKDGSRFWANVIVTPLRSADGELLGFAKVTRDLTVRRQVEEQARWLAAEQAGRAEATRRTEELARANEALAAALADAEAARSAAEQSAAAATAAYRDLDQFAYVASHDLKAPLRGIANLAQWIQEDAGPQIEKSAGEHLRLLQGRVRRMEALINGILTYSRAGRQVGQRETVDCGALLREVLDLLDPPESVTIRAPADMPTLETERVPLQQVFMNLIGNAIKHAAGERADACVEIGWRPLDGAVEFSVRDNGPGIAPEYQERIWGIFQTLAARDKVEGTGIGLSVVKKVVESRGGRVWVESAPGAGATFRFTVPATGAGVSRHA